MTSAQSGPYELRDNAGSMLSTLWAGRTATSADAAWVAVAAQADQVVPAAQGPSVTSVRIRLNDTLVTAPTPAPTTVQTLYLHVTVPAAARAAPQAGFLAAWNQNPKPFVWTATVESIVEKLSRCRQTLEKIQPGCTLPRRRKAKR